MAVQVMRLGQQAYVIKESTTGACIGVDLLLTEMDRRVIKNIITVKDLGNVSILMGTHDHVDHIDREMWKEAAALYPALRFAVPAYFEDTMPEELGIAKERFLFVDEGRPVTTRIFADPSDPESPSCELTVEALAAAHEFVETDDQGRHPCLMYLLKIGGRILCHMGDTCVYEGLYAKLRAFGKLDAIMAPINGRDAERYARNCIGNMTFQEAVDLIGTLSPKVGIPGHYDMFANNSEDPEQFTRYMALKYPAQKTKICAPGEWYTLPEE